MELAASMAGVFSPEAILGRLTGAAATPGTSRRDAPARHATLQATIDWSYQLLSGEQPQADISAFLP